MFVRPSSRQNSLVVRPSLSSLMARYFLLSTPIPYLPVASSSVSLPKMTHTSQRENSHHYVYSNFAVPGLAVSTDGAGAGIAVSS
jgi:hypothetical protein